MAKNKPVTNINDLSPDRKNANKGTVRGLAMVEASLREVGAGRSIVVDREGRVIAGNKTLQSAADIGLEIQVVHTNGERLVVVQRDDLDLSDDTGPARKLAYLDNRASDVGLAWDAEQLLADLNAGFSFNGVFDQSELDELLVGLVAPEPVEDSPPDVSKADELQKKWQTSLGQLWQLGSHRLICGDCTDKATVEQLMGGEKATLCHADPPYGMGKEKDGIANDNLYRNKLDEFQMLWWKTARPHLEDNASAYIWGNAEDLWRLWYVGGLKDSERLTLRNEIVWNKGEAGAGGISHMGAEGFRMYPNGSERALFFMLGEQGFNNNADNYWDGWEPVRAALEADCKKMGWGPEDIKRICGVGMYSHWFGKSQWTFIPAEHYKKLQQAAREHDAFKREHDAFKREHDAFKREHDELKQDFYATRAYFDNTHDNMLDVWDYRRVKGEDRHEHATPKPLEMVARAIKSSTPTDAIVYAPFNGTGPEIIACESLSRQCRAIELDAGYCAITLQRFQDGTGIEPVLIS